MGKSQNKKSFLEYDCEKRKKLIDYRMAKLAPSVLAADFSQLGDDIRRAEQSGVDMLHLDIMDGHFVPNISFGPAIVKTIDELTEMFLDVHLMLSEPEKYFEAFVKAGADSITFHYEARSNIIPLVRQIKALGCGVGLSIKPDTNIEKVLPFLEEVDLLLIMSVFPGFGGQRFIESTLSAVSTAGEYIDYHHLKTTIQVDGGIDTNNAASVVNAGADILVMGTAFFGCKDKAALVQKVKAL
ncbi:MAG: ribulose-phosphate 3-epimerase [candidate division Zixibacteria bacterium]|nr:ribulose-phosphate 3-epimerase [candidate division Zixibacteria bacterium]